MGYPALEHEAIPEVQEAVKRILTAAHDAGKYAGMFCTSSEHVRRRFKQGCMFEFILFTEGLANQLQVDLMNLGGDIVALTEWNATQLKRLDDIIT